MFSALTDVVARDPEGGAPADSDCRAAAATLSALAPAAVEEAIYRFRPKHPEPAPGKPWTWVLTLAVTVTRSSQKESRVFDNSKISSELPPIREILSRADS